MNKHRRFARKPSAAPRHARGIGLIEVLIAVLVMAIGMLGIAALQAMSLRNSQSSLERGNAVIQSYAIIDSMRANVTGVTAGQYKLATMQCAVLADNSTLAAKDINAWLASMKATLGNRTTTCGTINCTATNQCTVQVQWDDSRGADGSNVQTITTVARI